jgi:ubiquinone/menaquinone biosynthesis C-methylase UbiE
MIQQQIQPTLARMTFRSLHKFTNVYSRFSLPVVSTGRSFAYYRRIFFDGKSSTRVLRQLQGQRVLDIGCGLTPYVEDSMFQACRRAEVEFYGVDPKLEQGFTFGPFDRAMIRATGGGRVNPLAPGLDRGVAATADDLPFDDESVDLVISCYLLFAWIEDESMLDSIFREFHRVLKPGGMVKIFPAPHFAVDQIRHSELRQLMQSFAVEEEFYAGVRPATRFPPAYMRTMRKLK